MNIIQHYKRAVNLSKSSSRMTNADWYKKPLELEIQLHFYVDGAGFINAYLFVKSKNDYESLPSFSEKESENSDFLEGFIDQLFEREDLKKTKSLGVVLYTADELSIASLGPEHQNPSELEKLKKQIVADPGAILEDKTVSVDSHSWRIFPYRGAVAGSEFATAIVVSRKHAEMMSLLRKIGDSKNLPIVTSVLSAPICAVASVPWFSEANKNGTIVVYNYSGFTLLAFFNPAGNLMMLRNMLHPPGSDFPVNIGSAMAATSSAFELEAPEVNVVSMVNADTSELIASIQSGMKVSELMLIDAREILISRQLPANIPLEMLIATQGINDSTLASNMTFSDLKENEWHLQEFVVPLAEELAMFPSRADMKMLHLGRTIKAIGGLAAVLFASWIGFSVWQKTKTESWTCKPEDQRVVMSAFQKRLKEHSHYDNLFKDRSKAWVCMDLLTKVAPTGSPIYLKKVGHRVEQEQGKAIAQKIGLEKTWIIEGYTNEKGLVYLESISTKDKIRAVFNDVAKSTGNEAYLADIEGRDIFIDIKNANNNQRGSEGNDSPLSFTMNIKQSLPASDTVALIVGK